MRRWPNLYFQDLEIIRNSDSKLDQDFLKLLDDLELWLATRRTAIKDFINPVSFSDSHDLNIETVLDMFYIFASPEIGILRERYDIFIKQDNKFVTSYYNDSEIPDVITHPETRQKYKLNKDEDIRLYFELIKEPDLKPNLLTKTTGKDHGVGLSIAQAAKQRATFVMSEIIK